MALVLLVTIENFVKRWEQVCEAFLMLFQTAMTYFLFCEI